MDDILNCHHWKFGHQDHGFEWFSTRSRWWKYVKIGFILYTNHHESCHGFGVFSVLFFPLIHQNKKKTGQKHHAKTLHVGWNSAHGLNLGIIWECLDRPRSTEVHRQFQRRWTIMDQNVSRPCRIMFIKSWNFDHLVALFAPRNTSPFGRITPRVANATPLRPRWFNRKRTGNRIPNVCDIHLKWSHGRPQSHSPTNIEFVSQSMRKIQFGNQESLKSVLHRKAVLLIATTRQESKPHDAIHLIYVCSMIDGSVSWVSLACQGLLRHFQIHITGMTHPAVRTVALSRSNPSLTWCLCCFWTIFGHIFVCVKNK